MKNLYKKLQQFQEKITAIPKDSKNPFFNSKYFDVNKVIEIIRPILNELNLVVLQPLSSVNDTTAIKTIIIDTESGESIESISPITQLPDAQKMGSSITYFRRYSLVSFLLLQGEMDDDANNASNKVKPQADKGDLTIAEFELKSCANLEELKAMWDKIDAKTKTNPRLLKVKEDLKTKLK